MNQVKLNTEIEQVTTLADVLTSNETAFIGKCGIGPEHSLYLIVYGKIVLAGNPMKTWDGNHCSVTIDRYVNIEIKEISK